MSALTERRHMTYEDLEAAHAGLRTSPTDEGTVELIVRRPDEDQREVLEQAELDIAEGLVGDKWKSEMLRRAPDRVMSRENQVTIMNARVVDMIAGSRERWPLAGDQFYVDLDLSESNMPPGTQLSLGTAVIEITAKPHTGCGAFADRYGSDARSFVNAPERRDLHLRGLNAKVVRGGIVRVGDVVRKQSA